MTTDPYEITYELDALPPHEAVHYAEQALLGAVLLEPTQLGAVGDLLPEHFGNAAHGTLYTAMRAVPTPAAEVHMKDPTWLTEVLKAALPQAPGLNTSYMFCLIAACPRPAHAAAYARMIRSDHARRTIREHADRLAQTVTDPTLPDPVAATAEEANLLYGCLDDLAKTWTPHPGSQPRTHIPPRPTTPPDGIALDEERLFLSSATSAPETIGPIRNWLQPGDFLLPLHGQLYQCLLALTHRREVIDPVTVLWEAQHRGLLVQGVEPAELLTLTGQPAGVPEHWAERIIDRAYLTAAATAAHTVRTYTNDPAVTPHQLITGARRALLTLAAVHRRREAAHANGPGPPVPKPPRLQASLPASVPPTLRATRTVR